MNIPSNITRAFGDFTLTVRKHSPTILTVCGVVAGVAATGFAVRATLHCDEVLERHNEKMREIAKCRMVADQDEDIEYPDHAEKRDKQVVYLQTALDFARLYMPTILLTGLSITCVLSAHNILSKRNAAVVAAFAALSDQFESYREKVVNELGKEKDEEFIRGISEIEVMDDETGEVVEKKKVQSTEVSDLDAFFDELSPFWDHMNSEMNVARLRSTIKWANDQLMIHGHVFVNDIRRQLGLPDTPSGAVMGWTYDELHPDTMIDFGVFNGTDDPYDSVRDIPWDGTTGIRLTFANATIIYDKI